MFNNIKGYLGNLKDGLDNFKSDLVQMNLEASTKKDQPEYGVIGPSKEAKKVKNESGNQSFDHEGQMQNSGFDFNKEDVNEEDVVYECSGLASAEEMEVRNPIFEETMATSSHNNTSDTACNSYNKTTINH